MKLDLRDVARVIGATDVPVIGATDVVEPRMVSGWSIDSRTIEVGDLFFALRGPVHDGHEYVGQAVERGAVGAVVAQSFRAAAEDGQAGMPVLLVPDTLVALQTLARWGRERWRGKFIGVTGSSGKTTTKDVIAHLLSVEMAVGKTVGNLNNHVGVPLSILRVPDECRAAVLELGMNHAGEIRELARIARPDVAVVTNVGYAHAEFFSSIEGIAAAKRELIEGLAPDGVAVLNADDPLVIRFREIHPGRTITFGLSKSADIHAGNVEFAGNGVRFECCGVPFETPLLGRHGVLNTLAGIAVAGVFGIPPQRLREAVRTLAPGKMRGERLERGGVIIFNDCYNSNPEAVRSMVDLLAATTAARRLAVLGEMLELGLSAEPLHREVGRYVAEHGIDVLIGIRGAARHMVDEAMRAGLPGGAAHFFDDPESAGDFVRNIARAGDAVLFKGSRAVQVERALDRLLADGAVSRA